MINIDLLASLFAKLQFPKGFNSTINVSCVHCDKDIASILISPMVSTIFDKIANIVKDYYHSLNKAQPLVNQSVPIIVTYDWTWHREGIYSHYGVGVVIDLETGFVLDAHAVSNFCVACSRGPKQANRGHDKWWDKHKAGCQKNFEGSAQAMEVEAEKVMFTRSSYKTVLCDGDAKTVTNLNAAKVYRCDVLKEDCVNHIAKRMYSNVTRLKQQLRGTKDYYADSLKRKAPDVVAMRAEVYADLRHMSSSDSDPRHDQCPVGEMSWCWYNQETAMEKNIQGMH